MSSSLLRLGTRGSQLALAQSSMVARQIERANPGLAVELVILKTTGDRVQDKPLHEIGGKGLFTKELEVALLEERVDLAVHSMKDVPVTMPLVEQSGLTIACVPAREDVRDVLLVRDPSITLSGTIRVGTTSLRRRCQVLERAPDAQVLNLRGNIDTRIRKLRDGEFDAVLLAMAGLKRAGLFDPSFMRPIDCDELLPAAGQGALAVQCRLADERVRDAVAPLHDPSASQSVQIEREFVLAMNGDCRSPLAAWCRREGDDWVLSVAVGAADGLPPVRRATVRWPVTEPVNTGKHPAWTAAEQVGASE
jgi:hydroxymethylbilane synthase